jgi:hypothetical protein
VFWSGAQVVWLGFCFICSVLPCFSLVVGLLVLAFGDLVFASFNTPWDVIIKLALLFKKLFAEGVMVTGLVFGDW